MRLPLRMDCDNYATIRVVDAAHRIICSVADRHGDRQFAAAVVRKFNRDWRWVLFGAQPYEYSREDWLFEKSKA